MQFAFRMLVVVSVVMVVGVSEANAQRGGRGGRSGGDFNSEKMREMRAKMEAIRACPIDMMWAVLSFDLEIDEGRQKQLGITMRSAWRKRSDVLAFSDDHDAWDEGRKRLRDLRKKTDLKIRAILENDQWKAYEKALKKRQKAVRQEMPGGRL